ncbi:MAG TPA: chaperonin GroEL [Solirubrobacterales bacterium]|jgi:chaperonin GroEL
MKATHRPYKRLLYDGEAREALRAGVEIVARAVGTTLGPKGRYVLLTRRGDWTRGDEGGLTVTNDGITVARDLEVEDLFARQGVRLMREVAGTTNHASGDGTTTSTLLARAMVDEGLRLVAAGADPVALRRGIEWAADRVVAHIAERISIPVEDEDLLTRVTTIAAGDEEIGLRVVDAFALVARTGGVVDVEPWFEGDEITVEHTRGARVWGGYVSPLMITDRERAEAVLEEPYILIANQEIETAAQLAPVLERVAPTGKPLLVVADHFHDEAIALLVQNKERGILPCAAVKARFLGGHRRRHLQELAILTGGESIDPVIGLRVPDTRLEQLGRAERVVLTRNTMTIHGGAGDPAEIEARIARIEREIADPEATDWDRDRARERIGILADGLALIKVGAPTEVEIEERRLRTEDAVQAGHWALEDGIVPGGGVALLRCQEALDGAQLPADEALGAAVVARALEEPLRRIAANSGFEPSVVVERVRGLGPREGLDAETGRYVDLVEEGVIDPTRVVQAAVANAASIAKTVLLTECVVVEPRPPDPPQDPKEMPDPRRIPPKRMLYGAEARASLAAGVRRVADALRVTLGPYGRHVMFRKRPPDIHPLDPRPDPNTFPIVVTNDGVTIARHLELGDGFEAKGVELALAVASTANDDAGDGTTTATLLADAIVSAGQRNITAGADPLAVRRGIDWAVERAVERLRELAVEVEGREQCAQVATISAVDEEIGELVAEAFDRVGRDGVVNYEEGQSTALELDVAMGMQWDRGYVSRSFLLDPSRGEIALENPCVLVADLALTTAEELVPLLDRVASTGRPLLIVCVDVTGEALDLLVANNAQGRLPCLAVRLPDFTQWRRRNADDIAAFVGAEAITPETGISPGRVQLAQLGGAKRVVARFGRTTLLEGGGDPAAIEERADSIRRAIADATLEFERDKHRARLARLAGGIATIRVGAPTETEAKEKLLRVEDAVRATRAALEEGIVPGGGVALLRAREAIDPAALEGDERTGAAILREALAEPLRQLAVNSGLDPSVVVERVAGLGPREGLDAARRDYADLIERGIVDPAKVVRCALESAASVAKTILVTECVVAEAPQPKLPVPWRDS